MLYNKKYKILNFTKVSQEPPLAEKCKFELIIVFLKVEWSPLIDQEIIEAIAISVIFNFSLFILNAFETFAEVKIFSLLIIDSPAWT